MIGRNIEATRRFLVRRPGARPPEGGQAGGAAGHRLAPGVRDVWSRLVIARLMWILLMAVLVTGSAGGYLVLQKPMYKAQATVAIYPAAGATTAVQPFVMGTEKGVVSSGAVLSLASESLLIPVSKLQSGLSITVPVDSDLLVIAYTDRNPQVAQSAAEAIAQAYVAYRTTALGPTNARTASSSTASLQVAVVTDASLPTSPDGPNPLLTMGVALILGLALGIGLALILDWLDDRLRGPVDLQGQANSPVLAQIPAFDRQKSGLADGLLVLKHPDSPIAGAYRDLRTRVLQAALLRQARTLLVASPGREDRSTVAANLAASAALSGRRVVLVSADLREGNAHTLFGLKGGLGVTSVVAGSAELADALAPTEVHGLEVLAGGPATHDPSGVLQSHAFHVLLTMLRTGADLVVIDAPPVLASADAAALAESADMVLLVADARITSRAEVRAATHEFQHVRDRLIGCVLDGVGRPRRLEAPSRRDSATSDATISEPRISVEPVEAEDVVIAMPIVIAPRDIDVAHEMSSINGNGHAGLAAIPASNGVHHTPVKTRRRRNQGRSEL